MAESRDDDPTLERGKDGRRVGETRGEDRREIRVFVSSTFRDMREERELLVKRVFPKVKREAERRGVAWGEVDLRWGITEEEAAEGQVLPICLEEIRKCRPFFIGLLGERYGWVPEDFPEAVRQREPWIADDEGRSVTELEILHGVLNDPDMAQHAFFYIRHPAYVESLPASLRRDFVEQPTEREVERHGSEEAARRAADRQSKLSRLKSRLRASGMPVRDGYPDPKQLCALVEADLIAVLDELYPIEASLDAEALERIDHRCFRDSRVALHVGRREELAALERHASSGHAPILVVGESGVGKSALLAVWAKQHAALHPRATVIEQYIGASESSTDWRGSVASICRALKRRFDLPLEIPDLPSIAPDLLANFIFRVPESQRVAIVIDALDQLEGSERVLFWLPDRLPNHVGLVASSLPSERADALTERGWQRMTLAPLVDRQAREQFIDEYLGQFAKKLPSELKQRVVEASATATPIFLRTLLEEMRLYGDHESLARQLSTYLDAATPSELFGKVLERFERDFEEVRPNLVRDTMRGLWASRGGLSEAELLELLGYDAQPLPRLHLAPLLLACESLLVSRQGRLGFFHQHIRDAVRERYLPTREAESLEHLRLASYFRARHGPRRLTELPWQLQRAAAWEDLASLLTDMPFFAELWDHARLDVHRYWSALEATGAHPIQEAYARVVAHPVAYVPYLHDLARLFIDFGRLDEAGRFHEVLARSVRGRGDPQQLVPSLIEQSNIHRNRGAYEAALDELEHAERLSREAKDLDNLQRVLGNQAQVLVNLGEFAAAEAKIAEAKQVIGTTGDRYVLQAVLTTESSILGYRGDTHGALQLLLEAEKICEEIEDDSHLASKLLDQASYRRRLGELDAAFQLYERSYAIARELGDKRLIAKTLIGRSGILKSRFERDRALADLEEASRIAHEIGDKATAAEAWFMVANAKHDEGDVNGSAPLMDRAEALYRESGDRRGLVGCLNVQSLILQTKGELDAALERMEEAEALARELGMRDQLQAVLGNRAMIYRARGRLDEALRLYQEKESICREIGNKKSLAICLGNIGNVYHQRGDLDRALAMHREKAAIAKEIQAWTTYANALGNQAGMLIMADRASEAVLLLEEQEQICRRAGDKPGLAQCLLNQAVGLFESNDPQAALRKCVDAIDITNELGILPDVLRNALGLRQEILRRLS